jgi:hypothetical protein
MPDAMACQQLLAELDSSADDFIPQTPRSICAGSNKQKCCVSWSGSPTKNIVRKAKLALGLRNCQAMCGTQLSCRMLQWKLVPTHDGMVAASLCLSNRPKHCR